MRPIRSLSWLLGIALMMSVGSTTASPPEPLRYAGTVEFEPEAGGLTAALELDIPLDDDSGELAFFFNRGFDVRHLSGPAITGFAIEPMPGNPSWSTLTVAYDPEAAEGGVAMTIRYAGAPLMPENGINRITPDWIELTVDSAWHPVVATLLRPIDADLILRLPEDWLVITSGQVDSTEEGVRLRSRFPQSDIAFTAAPGLETAGDDAIRIHFRPEVLDDDSALVDRILGRAAACRDWLNETFGPDSRLPPLRFTITDRSSGGYARSNYIALTDVRDTPPESLTAFLCHELGHYWSRGGPPMTVENWLNEAFAVMLGALAVRDLYGQSAYASQLQDWMDRSQDAGSIWTPGDQARRSYEINYKKGPWFLHRLHERIGEDRFEQLLHRYALDPIDTTPGLLDAIETIAGAGTRAWAVDQLAADGPFVD